MDNLEIRVAVVGAFETVFDLPNGSPPFGTPSADLEQTTVRAQPDMPLREVLRRACDQLGITLTTMAREAEESYLRDEGIEAGELHVADKLVYIAFRRSDDDDVLEAGEFRTLRRDQRMTSTVAIVRDAEGRAVWKRPGLEATMAQLLDAAAVGLVEGDPLQPYLIPSIPQGDPGLLGEWKAFAESLRVLWVVIEAMAAVGGALQLLELLKNRRSTRVPEIVEKEAPGWTERGAAPADFFRFLIAKPRSSTEVASLLGCSVAEVQALLWGLGFAYDDDAGQWRYGGDTAARFLGKDVDWSFADLFIGQDGQDRFREFVAQRLARVLETGTVPTHEETERDISARRKLWFEELEEEPAPRRGFLRHRLGRRQD